MRKFREGGYNTLVATCVGEEGLDIGEVDLIVCFDAHKSPIRLVQRMGRTGRKRSGRIVVIVAQGKEEQVRVRTVHVLTFFRIKEFLFVYRSTARASLIRAASTKQSETAVGLFTSTPMLRACYLVTSLHSASRCT